ncbi:hypothetical protein RFI_07754 [Reticulomyxa filosa]|uniref:Uncharacterized protein n=1 Tax=Reticulomyxa filosa TaxID=46433 RepID=X6NTW6_RETFI|nr:hypothetical protein RFI_07754 [Reticulomyxa filosa]|eukprot:ETO29368.1 hypothetical protein RFI_07754 [Reticulomyxa filosa]
MADIKAQLDNSQKQADFIGTLVTDGLTERPTDWESFKSNAINDKALLALTENDLNSLFPNLDNDWMNTRQCTKKEVLYTFEYKKYFL